MKNSKVPPEGSLLRDIGASPDKKFFVTDSPEFYKVRIFFAKKLGNTLLLYTWAQLSFVNLLTRRNMENSKNPSWGIPPEGHWSFARQILFCYRFTWVLQSKDIFRKKARQYITIIYPSKVVLCQFINSSFIGEEYKWEYTGWIAFPSSRLYKYRMYYLPNILDLSIQIYASIFKNSNLNLKTK